MADTPKITGNLGWLDLTVDDAESIRDFYAAVTGWRADPCDMGGYDDYSMLASDGTAVAGICHARGSNTGLPAAWMAYITVADLETSLEQCRSRGGQVIHGPKSMGASRYAMIEDPAGAVCALYEENSG